MKDIERILERWRRVREFFLNIWPTNALPVNNLKGDTIQDNSMTEDDLVSKKGLRMLAQLEKEIRLFKQSRRCSSKIS